MFSKYKIKYVGDNCCEQTFRYKPYVLYYRWGFFFWMDLNNYSSLNEAEKVIEDLISTGKKTIFFKSGSNFYNKKGIKMKGNLN